MQTEHKKALVVIFSILFAALLIGTIMVAAYAQNIAIAGVMIVVSITLAIDILWVIKDDDDTGFSRSSI